MKGDEKKKTVVPRISKVVAASVVKQLQMEQLENLVQPIYVAGESVHWEERDNEK